jgi:wobble nucleotide-excising tRNase
MSEKKVSAIQAVTLNTATFENEPFTPTYINFFYGKNGAGKTSLGRQLGEGAGIQWADGEVPANYEICLYNQDFIDQHFRTLDRLRGVFSLSEGKETEEVEKRIKELEARRKELEKRKVEIEGEGGEREKASKALQTAQGNFEKACLNSTKLFREKFKQAFKGATRNPQLSQKINTTAPRDCDVDELEKRFLAAFAEGARMYPSFTELDGDDHIAAIPTCPLLAEEIISKGTTEYARFIRDLGALAWIEEGHQKYHESADGACPYCGQRLPADYESLYASCFDDEYQRKIKAIRDFPEIYMRHFGPVYEILTKVTEATDVLPSVAEKIEKLKPMVQNFLRAFRSIAITVDQKLKDPASPVTVEDLTPQLLDMNYIIHQCNEDIQKNNEVVEKLEDNQDQCVKDVWALAAFRLQGEIDTYHTAQEEEKTVRKALSEELGRINGEIGAIGEELEKLGTASTTIQAAIDGMNRHLRDSGFEGFEIVKSDMAKDAYKVVRGDKKVAIRLSDGERHFLSFLYFYNRVKGCDENGVQKDKIVVIDDPVSSLDGNALFIISSLVREMIEVYYNNTDYRGQIAKGDYIKQLFILTHNAQFHRGITYNQVGRFSCANFYKINKIDNRSTVKWCKRQSRSEGGEEENYNPVKNAYAALWSEYLELNNEIPLMNVIHRILDFYFLDMCGRDGFTLRDEILVKERDKFMRTKPDGTPDESLFQLADSMLMYMGAGVDGDMTLVSDGTDVEQIRRTFEMIFRQLGQGAHYDMMMERART